MKVTIIGGGSSYTPELIKGFLERIDTFPLTELWLMDIDAKRLAVVGGFAQRIVETKGSAFKVILSTDQLESVQGASYVITQLRVGQMKARREDEYLGQRHGLVGQETTGIGGMAKALRTIPVILSVAKDILKTAPGALLVNFTNPAGLVTEALSRYSPEVVSVGVCNIPITETMGILDDLETRTGQKIDRSKAQLISLGLNHLTWHYGFKIDGEDVWPQIIEGYLSDLAEAENPEWDYDMVKTLRMIPNYYLSYFYHTNKKLAGQEKWPPSRAEEVMEIEERLLKQYADPNLTEPPKDLLERGGAYYSTLATQLLNAHYNDLGETHIVNVPHRGAISGWPADWVLEMPCRVERSGIHPLPAEPLPLACFGLLAQVKAYELLTVEAAVRGDREAAYQAILAHPLGPTAEKIQMVLDDILTTHRDFLPLFWQS